MTVKVITDSTSDIPAELARKLDIEVVPVYVRFGETVYLDGIDIGTDDFYRKLAMLPDHPATSQPSPEDFAAVYHEHAKASDGIVTITISSKISGTYNSAVLAKSIIEDSVPVEVIDSKFNSAGLGLVVIAAARLART